MLRLGWIRVGVTAVSVAALLLALLIEPEAEPLPPNDNLLPLLVVSTPEQEYGALVAALQQQSERPIQHLPAIQHTPQPGDWILLADRHQPAQPITSDTEQPVATFIPAATESGMTPGLDLQASQQLLLNTLQARLGARDEMALYLPTDIHAWSSLAEPLQQQVTDSGLAELHLLKTLSIDAKSAKRLRGVDVVVTMGNQATNTAINQLKAVERLQTTEIVAVGFCWSLLDAVNAGTLDGLVFYHPAEIAEQLLAQVRGESVAPVAPVWVDKANVREIMARS